MGSRPECVVVVGLALAGIGIAALALAALGPLGGAVATVLAVWMALGRRRARRLFDEIGHTGAVPRRHACTRRRR